MRRSSRGSTWMSCPRFAVCMGTRPIWTFLPGCGWGSTCAPASTRFSLWRFPRCSSQVGAFPSRSLPARFNALLGDSSSPRFEWNDLTVYTVGMRWEHESDLEFKVDFHTRSQPTPTSPSLMAALDNELAQHSVLIGLGKGLGDRLRLDLTASYAPPEFAF